MTSHSEPFVVYQNGNVFRIITCCYLYRAGYYNEVVGYETTLHLAADNDFSPWVTADRQMGFSVQLLTRYGSTYDLLQVIARKCVGYDNPGNVLREDVTNHFVGVECGQIQPELILSYINGGTIFHDCVTV